MKVFAICGIAWNEWMRGVQARTAIGTWIKTVHLLEDKANEETDRLNNLFKERCRVRKGWEVNGTTRMKISLDMREADSKFMMGSAGMEYTIQECNIDILPFVKELLGFDSNTEKEIVKGYIEDKNEELAKKIFET